MNNKFSFVYSFYTNAFIKSNFTELKNMMNIIPDSMLLSEGTIIKYIIGEKSRESINNKKDEEIKKNKSNNESDNKLDNKLNKENTLNKKEEFKVNKYNKYNNYNDNYIDNYINAHKINYHKLNSYNNITILEFKKDSIHAMFYSARNRIESKAFYLLKFLSILEYIKNIYEVSLDGLYQDIISSLTPFVIFQSNSQGINQKDIANDKRIIELSSSNYALAKEIIKLSKINVDQKHALELFKEFYVQVLSKLANSIDENSTKTLVKLGISKELLDELTRLNHD